MTGAHERIRPDTLEERIGSKLMIPTPSRHVGHCTAIRAAVTARADRVPVVRRLRDPDTGEIIGMDVWEVWI